MNHLPYVLEILLFYPFFFALHFGPQGQKFNSTHFVFEEQFYVFFLFYKTLVGGVKGARNLLKDPEN